MEGLFAFIGMAVVVALGVTIVGETICGFINIGRPRPGRR
jgi:hypothetical protein